MARIVQTAKVNPVTGTAQYNQYHEFDAEFDGPSLDEALLKEYGTREACKEEMPYLTMIAAVKDDRTTLNALACVRKYWRMKDAGLPSAAEAKESAE